MKKVIQTAMMMFALQTGQTCVATAQEKEKKVEKVDTLNVEYVWNKDLPPGIAATVICDSYNLPVIVTADSIPHPSTLLHEYVHVIQFMTLGNGDCNKGRGLVSKDAKSLLKYEAEATCAAALYSYYHYGTDMEYYLARYQYAFHNHSKVRAEYQGQQWLWSLEEIGEAFKKACPTQKRILPQSSNSGEIDSSGAVHSSLPAGETDRKRMYESNVDTTTTQAATNF